MSNSTENTAALGAAEQEIEEESLVLKFRKPYKFEGQEYTEVDLSGMEARASHKPVEFFKGLPPVEAMKLKNLVTGFLYGGDGEE